MIHDNEHDPVRINPKAIHAIEQIETYLRPGSLSLNIKSPAINSRERPTALRRHLVRTLAHEVLAGLVAYGNAITGQPKP